MLSAICILAAKPRTRECVDRVARRVPVSTPGRGFGPDASSFQCAAFMFHT
ncbi:hypothetical protein F751_6374 [Auxenochlorella protothecoides]|uniref:Uncharacterized protein n=1 Tax=Auxenochlorella protothecoides TaxID=3075 RepID=A0A087SSB1_AUXPR|nr:hypothetical protein F751_6374 [Auxenochlorella protothecoides]KFM28615.1 hypothetical protein F751_6374 [Auxenochlorella protothecoides]